MGFVDPTYFKDQFGVEGRWCCLPLGCFFPTRESNMFSTPCREFFQEFPDVVYIILGATHPNELREHGEAYRVGLKF